MTTEARGNTKARAYQLTLNDVSKIEELKQNIMTYKSLRYLMIGAIEKAPTTGHEHVHIYAYFKTPVKLSIKKCCGAHVEPTKGTFNDNLHYLTKDGDLTFEWGERPHQGLKTVKELREMNADDVPPQYYNIKTKIDQKKHDEDVFFQMLDEIEHDELKAPEIVYITGGTGKGKTFTAYKTALKEFEKSKIGKLTLKNEFFDVINENADCFIIEEFRPSQIKASDFLQLTDKYGFRCNVKGGFCTLRPKKIFICSIIPPEQIYKEEVNKQFMRRISKVINLDEDPDMY
uniref:Replication-associated protein n=1 Tax=ssDNA virus sp. TaxID=2593122 RepID=A0A894JS14_9VIRU|nr:replication-associated protein [ssDNA virus sp.]